VHRWSCSTRAGTTPSTSSAANGSSASRAVPSHCPGWTARSRSCRLAPRVPLPIPVPELLGAPSGDYPWPFWGARLIPGRELADARPPGSDRVGAATGLGEFLRALHDPDLVPTVGAGLPHDPLRRADPGVRVPMARECLTRLGEYGVWNPAVEGLLAEAERLGLPTGPASVCHGDLHVRHLLVDEDAQAAGVIDWGDVCVADPALDLSLAYSGF
jgi:aminoglycoside phosphotransferase (APT) family kinase protein